MTLVVGWNGRHSLGRTFNSVADLLGAEYLVDTDKFAKEIFLEIWKRSKTI